MTTSGSGNERRRGKRRRRRLAVRFWWQELEGSGFTADISNAGLMIETTIPVGIGERIHIELELPGGIPFYAEGVVVRKKVYPRQAASLFKPGLGVRFVGLGEAVRAVMEGESGQEPHSKSEPAEADDGRLRLDLRDSAKLEQIYEQDIKYGGIRIPTSARPPVNEEVSVVFLLPEPNGTIECRGLVVAHVDEPPSVGLRLQEVDQIRGRLLEIIRGR